MPSACQHPALKAFLSHSRVALSGPDRTPKPNSVSRSTSLAVQQDLGAQSSIVKSLYHQVTSSLDDIFLKPSMIDVMAEKLNRQAVDIFEAWDAGVTQIGHYGLELGSQVLSPYALRALRSPSLQNEAFESLAFPFPSTDSRAESAPQPAAQQPSAQPQAIVEETGFTTPITDFLVEVFGLKNGDWLRKQALVIVMQQLLGSTIER
jgi:sorting nexin-25